MYNTPFGWSLWDDTVRVKDLEAWLDELKDDLEIIQDEEDAGETVLRTMAELESDISELEDFLHEISGYHTDDYLINESYWPDYVRSYVSDVVPDMSSSDWPMCHMTMDWDSVADELRADFAEASIGDVTFYFRA